MLRAGEWVKDGCVKHRHGEWRQGQCHAVMLLTLSAVKAGEFCTR